MEDEPWRPLYLLCSDPRTPAAALRRPSREVLEAGKTGETAELGDLRRSEFREVKIELAGVFFLLFLDAESFALTASGRPSHFELTLGTFGGSVLATSATPIGVLPPLPAVFLRCCWAYCSRADCEGSFTVKKLSMLFFFLGFGGSGSKAEVVLLERETEVGSLRGVEEKGPGDDVGWERAVGKRRSGKSASREE